MLDTLDTSRHNEKEMCLKGQCCKLDTKTHKGPIYLRIFFSYALDFLYYIIEKLCLMCLIGVSGCLGTRPFSMCLVVSNVSKINQELIL